MHLKSVTLRGFKSFPGRTRLDFGPGVSVVVGPNGSGKSNITDAVLWAMGEQSPLAVRGQSMQDVIFGGGHGVQARSEAEVEIVLDNADGTVPLPMSEVSIVRRLDRTGEGGYRLNGARCRLVDVIEVLSDTGLGKEMHSIISQGRVDAIVSSRPRERRLLIEEAAGLGKHRKRRRRAQLKLERTQENLDRVLDVEREARSRLRPLKRQAEAAELHERLERQTLEARLKLARNAAIIGREELELAEANVAEARSARAGVERELEVLVERRAAAERALAERAERHDALARRLYDARSARERIELRAEQIAAAGQAFAARIVRAEAELRELGDASGASSLQPPDGVLVAGAERIAALEQQLAELDLEHEREIEREIAELRATAEREAELVARLEGELAGARRQREREQERAVDARENLAACERAVQDGRREAERVGAELAAVNQFLRAHARFGYQHGQPQRTLSDELRVQDGYELALAAALGGRLDAALVSDIAEAEALLDRAGPDGGSALLAEGSGSPAGAAGQAGRRVGRAGPLSGAVRLLELVSGPSEVLALAERLLVDAWVVERLEVLPRSFAGIAVTRDGRVWFGASGEVRQLAGGGTERVLARRNERDRLIAQTEAATQREQQMRTASEQALADAGAAEDGLLRAEGVAREADRRLVEAREAKRLSEWLIEQRRSAPAQGPSALRRAELEGELMAERRAVERIERERRQRAERVGRLRAQQGADRESLPRAEQLQAVLKMVAETVSERVTALERELDEHRLAGEQMAAELSACAVRESEVQANLRAASERVTEEEVAAQRLRDRAAEADLELQEVTQRLGLDIPGAQAPDGSGGEDGATAGEAARLDEQQVQALNEQVQRLVRRREQLGPVNPLAQEEYAEAIARVEELEEQRVDLETALRELRTLIRDTDEQIRTTFEATFAAAASNFAELISDVFPGGSGRLELVADEQLPRAVLGGQPPANGDAESAAASEAAAEAEAEAAVGGEPSPAEELGVEIEVTPAGKATKRLSLLSGGEKSMTALAFLFAVFLARPCPFYILDEVEAALDDSNLDRFLVLLRRYSERAQFIVITHQKRTMEAADWLYGVSMGRDGVSKVLSQKLPPAQKQIEGEVLAATHAAAAG